MSSGSRAELSGPDTLRNFISTLQSFNSELQASASNLSGSWSGLQQAWRDPQCDRFAADWERTHMIIEKYLSGSDAYVTHLQAKLRQAEEYGR